MKTISKNIRITFWVMLGLALSLTSLALNRPLPAIQEATATPICTRRHSLPSAAAAVAEVGSTDEIMLMAVLIVLIVIIPILLKRQSLVKRKTEIEQDSPSN